MDLYLSYNYSPIHVYDKLRLSMRASSLSSRYNLCIMHDPYRSPANSQYDVRGFH